MMKASEPSETVVWIVEDQDLYRETVASVLEQAPGLTCPVAVESCEDALKALADYPHPHIVLMDIGLPGMSGIQGLTRFREMSPQSRLIMLTVHEDREHVFEAVCAGASGYLLKPTPHEQIVKAIEDVRDGAAPINSYIARKMLDMFSRLAGPAGDYGLTPREKEILQLMVEGLIMKQIADRLNVSYHTIDTHIRHIYEKLHVQSRGGAVAKALKERLV